jgi:aminoglycoside phosphotransferase (APT) family kinase protein
VLARSAIDVLHTLQAVPSADTGIADDTPMTLKGELGRWTWLMERVPQELTGHGPALAERLSARIPADKAPVMVHGDYHFGNMLFAGQRVAAVLDWEIAELGHPLLDLCCLCVVFYGSEQRERKGWGASHGLDAEAVCAIFGADPTEFRWTLALTYYKYAAILGYNLMLHRRGKRPDPSYERRTDTIVGFIESGLQVLA